jgi:anti-sigma regulatory factor (Ser/Thr protein kinase)
VPEASHTFTAQAGSVREARHFLRGCLEAWRSEGYELSGEQVVSELATNAALHAHSEYTVHLRLDADSLLVEVSDASHVRPQQRHYAADATTGRGLMLVEALAEDWGVQASPTGKTVWCRISASGDLSPLFDDSWQETDPATRPGAPTIGEGTTRGARAIAA